MRRHVAGMIVPTGLCAGNQQAPNIAYRGKRMILAGRMGLSSKGRARGWVYENREENLAQVVGKEGQ